MRKRRRLHAELQGVDSTAFMLYSLGVKRRDAVEQLTTAGYQYDYTRGSHAYYTDPLTGHKIPVPMHGSRDLTDMEASSVKKAVRKAGEARTT